MEFFGGSKKILKIAAVAALSLGSPNGHAQENNKTDTNKNESAERIPDHPRVYSGSAFDELEKIAARHIKEAKESLRSSQDYLKILENKNDFFAFYDGDSTKVEKEWESARRLTDIENVRREILRKEAQIKKAETTFTVQNLGHIIGTRRQKLYENVKAADYLDKLKREGLSDSAAKAVQTARLDRLKKSIYWFDVNLAERKGDPLAVTHIERDNTGKLNAQILFDHPEELVNDETMSIEELEHLLTLGNFEMTDSAIHAYKNAYIGTENFKKLYESDDYFKKYTDGKLDPYSDVEVYLSEPTEMDARKKILESEMERLGIKKISDPMDSSHYDMLMRILKEDDSRFQHDRILSNGCREILKITTEDGLIHVMNEVALNEAKPDEGSESFKKGVASV
ncbi:MAG: hypothetical protein WCG55_04685 [bacterium]